MDKQQAFRKELERLRTSIREALAKSEEARTSMWERIAQENGVILSGPETALSLLQDADPKVRRLALFLYSERRSSDSQVVQLCEQLALNDPDAGVRAVAAFSLGVCHKDSCNPRISDILAEIAANKQNPDSVRHSAYVGLSTVQGRPLLSDYPAIMDKNVPVEEVIDWEFLGRFTREDREGGALGPEGDRN